MFSTWIGIVLLFAIFGLLAWVLIGASPRGDTYEQKRATAREEKLQKLQEGVNTTLTTYGWVDKNKGVAHVPIIDAMKLAMVELAQKKPAPANPIAVVPPENAPPQTNVPVTASPIPAGSPSASGSASPHVSTIVGPGSEIHNQPAAAANPAPVGPGTQPGASATPPASPASQAAQPQRTPSATPAKSTPGSPLPVRGKTP